MALEQLRFAVTHPMHTHPYNPDVASGAGVIGLAVAAEKAGFHGFGFTDHPAPSARWLAAGGHDALDPFVAMSFAAAHTTTLRMIPNIVVLPYRNPFVVAKSGATLDLLSNGRFTLAVGVGYMKKEFAALGVDFEERAALFDEALEVIRGIWTTDDLVFEGRHFEARGITAHPRPVSRPYPPIWIGGNTSAARRRVVAYGDGWCPFPAPAGLAQTARTASIDSVERLAKERRPKVILAGGSAIPRLIDFARFRAIADEVGAIFWVDAAHFIGLVAGGAIPSPVPYADVVSFTTHKVLRGPRSGAIVCKAEHATAIDRAVFPMMQGGPQMHTIAAKAVNFKECATPEYAAYTRQVVANAKVLAQTLGEHGIRPTTGGTDTHLSLHDLQPVQVTGVDAEARADAAGITLNKNAIPFDPQSPNIASGVRVGTPCVTTQGMGEDEMRTIAELIAKAVVHGDADPDHAVSREVRAQVSELVGRFPAYPRAGAAQA